MRTTGRRSAAAALLLGGSVGLILAELAVRTLAPQWSDQWKMWRLDERWARGMRPNVDSAVVHGHSGKFSFAFSTNARGHRGRRAVADLPDPDRPRILVVGDSFAFGYGVGDDETFSSELERQLARRGQSSEVVNAGFESGYTLDTEYIYLRESGAALLPSVVIVTVCLYNDLDDLAGNRWEIEDGRIRRVGKASDGLAAPLKRSGLVNLLAKGVLPGLRARLQGRPVHPRPDARPTIACDEPGPQSAESGTLGDGLRTTQRIDIAAPEALPERSIRAWSPTQRARWLLEAWANHAASHRYALALLLVPDATEVELRAAPNLVASTSRRVFAKAASEAGVTVFDPVTAMRAHFCDTGERLYYDWDGHWRAAGHRFIATYLADRLVDAVPRDRSRPGESSPR